MEPLVLANGAVSRGILTRPNEGDLGGTVNAPRLVLRVRHNSIINTGALIRTMTDKRYLVAEQADIDGEYRAHKLFLANRQVEWKRGVTTKDPLTKQDKTVYD